MPAALALLNSGAPLTKWSSKTPTTSGSRSSQATPGEAVTEMKSRPKNTPSTRPVSNSADASGEDCAVSASGKSRLPASITGCPGRNLRVAGLGVCSVRINMLPMWSCGGAGSSAEGRCAADDPASYRECRQQADDCQPTAG